MPIRKRTSIPKQDRKPRAQAFDPYTTPGIPIENLIKKYDKEASDAAWEGDDKQAERSQKLANHYRERLADGELYEIEF